MITDLIGETKATHEAINSALEGVHEAERMNEQPQMNAPPPDYEADLFGGFDTTPAPASVAESVPRQAAVQEPMAPPISTVSTPDEEPAAQAPPPATVSEPSGAVETVMSSDDEAANTGAPPPAAANAPISMFPGSSPAVATHKAYEPNPAATSSPSAAEVEDIKVRAQQAEKRAQDAEATRRSLAEQAEDLRKLAEQAENEMREAESHTGHKRGLIRKPGAKKKEAVRKQKCDFAMEDFLAYLTVACLSTNVARTRHGQTRCRGEEEAVYGYANSGKQCTSIGSRSKTRGRSSQPGSRTKGDRGSAGGIAGSDASSYGANTHATAWCSRSRVERWRLCSTDSSEDEF